VCDTKDVVQYTCRHNKLNRVCGRIPRIPPESATAHLVTCRGAHGSSRDATESTAAMRVVLMMRPTVRRVHRLMIARTVESAHCYYTGFHESAITADEKASDRQTHRENDRMTNPTDNKGR